MFRRLLTSLILLLLPVAAYVAVLRGEVDSLFVEGETGGVIVELLIGLVVLAAVEVVVLRCFVLPKWTLAIGERLYGGGYMPGDDAVVSLAEEIRQKGDSSLLPRLERLVQADPSRLRGWRELADVQQNVFGRPEQALRTLVSAAQAVPDKEDRAMLLYRAARLAGETLRQADEAGRLYAEAATRYPRTVYGRKAATLAR